MVVLPIHGNLEVREVGGQVIYLSHIPTLLPYYLLAFLSSSFRFAYLRG